MEIGDGLYQTILVVHILSAVVAFGPNFALPAARRAGGGAIAKVGELATFVQLPALFGVLVTGIGMLTAWPEIDDKSAFAQVWVSIAFLAVIGAAVLVFLLGRATREGGNEKLVSPLSGVLHLILVVAIFLMVVQPG
jgi:hypothetical protein